MQDQETQDFERGSWVLRALFLENVQDADNNDEAEDMVFWFVSTHGEDQWFAHGISGAASDIVADAMHHSFGDGLMTVMVAVAGHPWAEIAAMPTQIAQLQRDLLEQLQAKPHILDELMVMSIDDLRAWRAKAELGVPRSMN